MSGADGVDFRAGAILIPRSFHDFHALRYSFSNSPTIGRRNCMLGALVATVLFASSAIFGQRLSRILGGIVANFWRLVLAVACLGVVTAIAFRDQFPADADVFGWLFLSGVVGFGIGDVGLFLAYYRIGARLTILLNLCLAPVFGAVGEYLWMGQKVTTPELLCILLIVVGIVLALKPDRKHPPGIHGGAGAVGVGILCAVVAGMGQGFGAVISRYAGQIALESGVEMSGVGGGLTQAFVRTLGGLVIAFLCYAALRWGTSRLEKAVLPDGVNPAAAAVAAPQPRGKDVRLADAAQQHRKRGKYLPFWIVGAALTGPVLGVSAFQWALQSEKSAIVLAITATSPLIVMLLSRLVDKERTPLLAILGAVVSIAGVITICLMKLP